MKTILIIILGMLLIMPIIHAQEYTQEDANRAGLLPDSKLYPLKIAIQKITELFGGENTKLKHAEQRLSEIKVMIHLRMENQTRKSIDDFNRIYNSIKNKTALEKDKKIIDNLGQKISAITSQPKGNMTLAERENIRIEIKQLINQHKEIIIQENKPIINITEKINEIIQRKRW